MILGISQHTRASSHYELKFEDFKQMSKKEQIKVIENLQSLAVAWEAQVPQASPIERQSFYSPRELEKRFVFLMNLLVASAQAQEDQTQLATEAVTQSPLVPGLGLAANMAATLIKEKQKRLGWTNYLNQIQSQTDTCMYAGWISLMSGGYCQHPERLEESSPIRVAYLEQKNKFSQENENTCQSEGFHKIACNPAMFGNITACVSSGIDGENHYSRNSSLACMGEYQKLKKEDPQLANELLENVLSNSEMATYFAEVMNTAFQMCVCADAKGISQKYAQKMFYHRTCFSLMEQAQTNLSTIKNLDVGICETKININDQEMPLYHFMNQVSGKVHNNIEARLAAAAAASGKEYLHSENQQELVQELKNSISNSEPTIDNKEFERQYKDYFENPPEELITLFGGDPTSKQDCSIEDYDPSSDPHRALASPEQSPQPEEVKECKLIISFNTSEEDKEFSQISLQIENYELQPTDEIKWSLNGQDPSLEGEGPKLSFEMQNESVSPGTVIAVSLKPTDPQITCQSAEYVVKEPEDSPTETIAEDCEINIKVDDEGEDKFKLTVESIKAKDESGELKEVEDLNVSWSRDVPLKAGDEETGTAKSDTEDYKEGDMFERAYPGESKNLFTGYKQNYDFEVTATHANGCKKKIKIPALSTEKKKSNPNSGMQMPPPPNQLRRVLPKAKGDGTGA